MLPINFTDSTIDNPMIGHLGNLDMVDMEEVVGSNPIVITTYTNDNIRIFDNLLLQILLKS